jgi:hypothetical protein
LLSVLEAYWHSSHSGTAHTNAGAIESVSSDIAPSLLAATPEPPALIYLAMGFLGIVGFASKRARAAR